MVSRDYTKELGLKPATRTVPLPVAIVILFLLAGLVWFGIAHLPARASHTPVGDGAAPSPKAATS